MRIFKRLAAALVGGALVVSMSACGGEGGGSASSDPNTLSIYVWAGEVPPETIAAFEEETGKKVIVDTYDSNETMTAKLAAGAAGYDIVQPSQQYVQQLAAQGLLEDLDHSKLTGLDNLGPKFRDPVYDPGLKNSVPWVWGTTGIAYNKTCVKEPITSWKQMWDPQYQGKMYMLDNMLAAYIAGLQINGFRATSTNEDEIKKATESLMEQKPLLAGYNSTNFAQLVDTGQACIVEAWGDARIAEVVERNPDVVYTLPEEGGTLWVDGFAIPKSAPNKDAAYEWLNFTLKPEVAAAATNAQRIPTPNSAALPSVEQSIRENEAIFVPEDKLAKADFILDPGKAMNWFQQGWTQVKSS